MGDWVGDSGQRHAIREARTQPLMQAFKVWLLEQMATLSRKSVMADAINYSLKVTPDPQANLSW